MTVGRRPSSNRRDEVGDLRGMARGANGGSVGYTACRNAGRRRGRAVGYRSASGRTRRGYGDPEAAATHHLLLAHGLATQVLRATAAAEDYVDPEGAVHGPERVTYLQGHLAAAARAIQAGGEPGRILRVVAPGQL